MSLVLVFVRRLGANRELIDYSSVQPLDIAMNFRVEFQVEPGEMLDAEGVRRVLDIDWVVDLRCDRSRLSIQINYDALVYSSVWTWDSFINEINRLYDGCW